MAGQHGSGILNERQVGHALLQRGRHRDEGDVESLALLFIPRRHVVTGGQRSLELRRRDVLDVGIPRRQPRHARLVGVEAHHFMAHLHGPHGERQSDIALTDDHH